MYLQQFAMLVLEAAMMAGIVFALFRARTVLGLAPLYVVLGGFQYLEATLSLRVEVMPGLWIYPASAVMFTAMLVAVLVIYIKEDAVEARTLVYGLVLANAAVSVMSLVIGWHVTLPGSVARGMASQNFMSSAWIAMGGTSLLFLDVLGIILTYEYISRFTSHLFARLFVSLAVIVTIDNVLFALIVQAGRPDIFLLMASGVAGKITASAFYSAAAWSYLRFAEPRATMTGTGDVTDVFHTLTYRQKYEHVRERMVRDSMTGLYNRGYFDEALPQALARARRQREPLGLLLIDADNLKGINDQLSHMEGDAVLRLIGGILMTLSRAGDVPCRYGGDEFVVLLPGSDAAAAGQFAERFRARLDERCRTENPPYPWGIVTTTAGVSTWPADGAQMTPDELVRLADRRLYEGKHAGRDTVVMPV